MIAKSLLSQWIDLKKDFPRHIVLIQCGVFYETYQDDAEFLSEISNIRTYQRGKCNVAGFPIKSLETYTTNIEQLGYAVAVIAEIDWDGQRKIRGIAYLTGQVQSIKEVQEQKREVTTVRSRKARSKTLETLRLAKSLKEQNAVDLALTQIGYMFNAFEDDAKILSEKIGLKSFERYGFLTVGFPVNAQETYLTKIREASLSYVTIIETEKNARGSVRKLGDISPRHTIQQSTKTTHPSARLINAIDQNSLKAVALAHAKKGFYVIPLVENSKRPLISDWQKRATTNPLQIDSWWTEYPNANIGIACEVSNLIIIDLDKSKGATPPSPWKELGIKDGEGVFREVCREVGDSQLFDTYTVATPSGGKHLYFYDQNIPIKQGVEINGWWRVDTRSKGGYIVAEGSRLLNASGKGLEEYRSTRGASVILNFPIWIRDKLSARAYGAKPASFSPQHTSSVLRNPIFSREFARQVLSERCNLIRSAREGTRNQSLIRHSTYIGKIIRMGSLDEGEASDSLLKAAVASGLTRAESINAITAGLKYGKNLEH